MKISIGPEDSGYEGNINSRHSEAACILASWLNSSIFEAGVEKYVELLRIRYTTTTTNDVIFCQWIIIFIINGVREEVDLGNYGIELDKVLRRFEQSEKDTKAKILRLVEISLARVSTELMACSEEIQQVIGLTPKEK